MVEYTSRKSEKCFLHRHNNSDKVKSDNAINLLNKFFTKHYRHQAKAETALKKLFSNHYRFLTSPITTMAALLSRAVDCVVVVFAAVYYCYFCGRLSATMQHVYYLNMGSVNRAMVAATTDSCTSNKRQTTEPLPPSLRPQLKSFGKNSRRQRKLEATTTLTDAEQERFVAAHKTHKHYH